MVCLFVFVCLFIWMFACWFGLFVWLFACLCVACLFDGCCVYLNVCVRLFDRLLVCLMVCLCNSCDCWQQPLTNTCKNERNKNKNERTKRIENERKRARKGLFVPREGGSVGSKGGGWGLQTEVLSVAKKRSLVNTFNNANPEAHTQRNKHMNLRRRTLTFRGSRSGVSLRYETLHSSAASTMRHTASATCLPACQQAGQCLFNRLFVCLPACELLLRSE